jgi:ABC-type lipoprotein release transport system permease subunit
MFLLIRLSLRNLLRQKRRNLLLGSAMAIGVMLLVVAHSFSRGISDVMMNKVMRWVTGHVTIAYNERGRIMSEVFRDKQRILDALQGLEGEILAKEEAIGVFARAIGNGKGDNVILVGGGEPKDFVGEEQMKEMKESFRLTQGQYSDLLDSTYENPAIISEEKARQLNVKVHDVLRLRMRNMFGQDQAAKITIVGLMQNDNMFMQPVAFLENSRVRKMLGFDEHSTGLMNLIIKDPKRNAAPLAEKIHARLQPGLAVISGVLEANHRRRPALVLGFRSEPDKKDLLEKNLVLLAGSLEEARSKKLTLVARPLAEQLGLRLGSEFTLHYIDKWGRPGVELTSRVGGIFEPGTTWGPRTVLMHDERFYDAFYPRWPPPPAPEDLRWVPKSDHPAYLALAPEWILLPRTSDTKALEKKYKDMAKNKWKATLVDVRTMYETASEPLKLEGVLNLITLSAVLVLLVITLLGVINTLRMTIRERTREIGTVRAIGMQRRDVRNLFLLETFFLALFASSVGVVLALLIMWGLSGIPIKMDDNPMGMLLVNSRLYFLPTIAGIIGNVCLILLLAVATAIFPARRAAKLSPAAALRHFE